MTLRRTKTMAKLGALAAIGAATVLASASPASAADPVQPVPGVTITTEGYATGAGPLTVDLTTARSLSVKCNSTGKVIVNGKVLKARCDKVDTLIVHGSPGNDQVDIDARAMFINDSNGGINAFLGAGNDTAVLRHANTTRGRLWGEDGNDVLMVGFDSTNGYAGEFCSSDAIGGPGNDTVRDLGYLGTAQVGGDGQPCVAGLNGGPGVDRITSDATRPEGIGFDLDDKPLHPGSGINSIGLTTTDGPDAIKVHNDGNWGTKIAVTHGATTQDFTMPKLLKYLIITAGAATTRW